LLGWTNKLHTFLADKEYKMVQSLEEFMKAERIRLNDERKVIIGQQRDLEKRLADTDQELAAIAAYEITKSGRFTTAQKAPAARVVSSQRRPGASFVDGRGGKRAALLTFIEQNPGLKRGDILKKMGAKGDKRGEMSVSSALTALARNKQVIRRDGMYSLPGPWGTTGHDEGSFPST
jgi:hypothetical protein